MKLVFVHIYSNDEKSFTAKIVIPLTRFSHLIETERFGEIVGRKLNILFKGAKTDSVSETRDLEFKVEHCKVLALHELVQLAFPDAKLRYHLEN